MFFRFERQIGHHLIQTFAPSTLVVMLSWFSFWLGLDAIPGRVALLVTSMLTLVTMFTGLKSDIPPVAYVKVGSNIIQRVLLLIVQPYNSSYSFFTLVLFLMGEGGILYIHRSIQKFSLTISEIIFCFTKYISKLVRICLGEHDNKNILFRQSYL